MKRRELFTVYDYSSIIRHLERMALKGYKLKKIGSHWHYEKINPQPLYYDLLYLPENKAMNSETTGKRKEEISRCETLGWEHIDGIGLMEIFVTEKTGIPPIEIDDKIKVKSIEKIVGKMVWIVPILIVMPSVSIVTTHLTDVAIIAGYSHKALIIVHSILIAIGVLLFANHFAWKYKAKKNIEQGLHLPYTNTPTVIKSVMVLFILMVIVGVVAFFMEMRA